MRTLGFALAATIGLAFAACGENSNGDAAKQAESKPAESTDAPAAGAAPDAPPVATAAAATAPASAGAGKDRVVMEVKGGKVVIELRPDLAPRHVERIKQLSGEGFYNGLKFHRVIDGFMAQTGDPTGTGMSGSKYPDLPAEFTPEPFKRGTVGAARTNNPNSANSQFFICFTDNGCSALTGKYTVWGRVVEGMQHLDGVKRGVSGSGMVENPDIITKMSVE